MFDSGQFLKAHEKAVIEMKGILESNSSISPNYQVYYLNDNQGSGFHDLYDLGKIIVVRGNFVFNSEKVFETENELNLFGFALCLDGPQEISTVNSNEKHIISPPELLLRKGRFGKVTTLFPKDTLIQRISIDFHPQLLTQLNLDQHCQFTEFFTQNNKSNFKFLSTTLNWQILLSARQLLQLAPAKTELDLISIESEALRLLALILQNTDSNREYKYKAKIDHAIKILTEEYVNRLSTRDLSRRVGLNECTLKQAFKQYTGTTIAAFQHQQRMQNSLSLLAKGMPAIEVAYQLGYDNPYYFYKKFHQQFGYKIN